MGMQLAIFLQLPKSIERPYEHDQLRFDEACGDLDENVKVSWKAVEMEGRAYGPKTIAVVTDKMLIS